MRKGTIPLATLPLLLVSAALLMAAARLTTERNLFSLAVTGGGVSSLQWYLLLWNRSPPVSTHTPSLGCSPPRERAPTSYSRRFPTPERLSGASSPEAADTVMASAPGRQPARWPRYHPILPSVLTFSSRRPTAGVSPCCWRRSGPGQLSPGATCSASPAPLPYSPSLRREAPTDATWLR